MKFDKQKEKNIEKQVFFFTPKNFISSDKICSILFNGDLIMKVWLNSTQDWLIFHFCVFYVLGPLK